MIRRLTIIIFIIFWNSCLIFGQRIYSPRTGSIWKGEQHIGFSLGIMTYFGDMNPIEKRRVQINGDVSAKLTFGVSYSYRFGDVFGAQVGYTYGRLEGDDFTAADPYDEKHRHRFVRNAHFRNDIHEVYLTGSLYVFPFLKELFNIRNLRALPTNPYITFGVSAFYHNPRAITPPEFGSEWVDLRPLKTEGVEYSPIAFAIPFGIGTDFRLTRRLKIGVEIIARYTFTDYLDDVSNEYPDINSFDSDLARAMSNRTFEETGALTGGLRVPERDRLLGVLNGGEPTIYITDNGQVVQSFAGFGSEGDKRGTKSNSDVFVFTGFTLSYFLNPAPACPVFFD